MSEDFTDIQSQFDITNELLHNWSTAELCFKVNFTVDG